MTLTLIQDFHLALPGRCDVDAHYEALELPSSSSGPCVYFIRQVPAISERCLELSALVIEEPLSRPLRRARGTCSNRGHSILCW
jgi:hypothetical protein